MLTPDMSVSQWWIFAVVSGLALWLAMTSLVTARRHRWGAAAVPLAGIIAAVGQSAARGFEAQDAPFIFSLVALTLVILRIVFSRWINHQKEAQHAGKPENLSVRKQTAVFLSAFVAVLVLVALLIA